SAAARSLVTATGPAAAHRGTLGELLALLHLEGVAATAGRDRVRVVDLEAGLLESVQKVDRCAAQVGGAERIDDDVYALELELVVAVGGAGVESEPVLETRATAALDRDAKDERISFGLLCHQLLDLRGRFRREGQEGLGGALGDLHASMVSDG